MKSLIDENLETLDDLMCGYKVIQYKNGFRFSLDAVLLSHFATIKDNDTVADFCSGSGVVAILVLAHNKPQKVSCIEIQPEYCEIIDRSIAFNSLGNKMEVFCADAEEAAEIFGYESLNCVVCNPPYLKKGTGKTSVNNSLNIARREERITLEGIVRSASKVLKNKGRFSMVHLAERADEIFSLMSQYKLTVKRAQLVQPKESEKPNLILVEGIKNASKGISWLPALIVYKGGDYTETIKDIYGL